MEAEAVPAADVSAVVGAAVVDMYCMLP